MAQKLEIGLSPMQTHEVRDVYEQTIHTVKVETTNLKSVGISLTLVYLILLIIQPSISSCFRKFGGTLVFGVVVSLTLLLIFISEERLSVKLKQFTRGADGQHYFQAESESLTFNTRLKIFAFIAFWSILLTFPLDYAVIPHIRKKIDCHRYEATNAIKITGVLLMIFNMSILLGRIVIIKINSLNCLRYLSLRKVKLLKRVSRRINPADLAAVRGQSMDGDPDNTTTARLTFLKPTEADEDAEKFWSLFFKVLIGLHNEVVAANTQQIFWLLTLFIAQIGFCVNTYYHEHVLGPNDVQQLAITFLLLAVLSLSLTTRLGYMAKIYENEEIVNEEAAAVEALTSEQIQLVLVTSVTVLSTIMGRIYTFLNDSDIKEDNA